MPVLAQVTSGAVAAIAAFPAGADTSSELAAGWLDVSSVTPPVQVGATYAGGAFTNPSVVASLQITPLQFRALFTPAETTGIYIAAHAAMNASPPNPALQIWLDDSAAADYIDLMDARTTAGIAALVSFGLLTQARAIAIIANQAPPTS
jgi:hypothetical protein